MIELFLTLIAVLILLHYYLTWNYDYWKKRNVKFLRPTIFFGNYKDILLMKKNMVYIIDDFYWMLEEEPAIGLYKMRQPQLLLRDPALVHQVVVKDFHKFRDNDVYINDKADPILGKNPFFSLGDNWKELRAVSTPFVTPLKIKGMTHHMNKVANDMVEFLKEKTGTPLEANFLCGQYTTDVMTGCIWSLESNSFKDTESEFRRMTDSMIKPGARTHLVFMLTTLAPWLNDLLNLSLFPKEVSRFYVNIVRQSLDHRKKNSLNCNDILQTLIDTSDKKGHSLLDLAAHCVTVLLDGYHTSAIMMSNTLYQLACSPAAQQTLREELTTHFNSHHDLDFTTVTDLPYLDAVIKESMRLFPPLTMMTKVATKDCELESNGRRYPLKRGTTVVVPLYSLHRDPAHFQEPSKFLPERFLQHSEFPAYLPFNLGPRACPGSRLALTQVKIGIASLLLNYSLKQVPGHPPPTMDPKSNIFGSIKDGLWISVDPL